MTTYVIEDISEFVPTIDSIDPDKLLDGFELVLVDVNERIRVGAETLRSLHDSYLGFRFPPADPIAEIRNHIKRHLLDIYGMWLSQALASKLLAQPSKLKVGASNE